MTRKWFMVLMVAMLASVLALGCFGEDKDGDDDSDGDGSDKPGACTPEEFTCQGDDIYKCNAAGSWAFYLSCAGQGYVCRDGLCVPPGQTDGDQPDGDQPDGDQPDGDQPDGDQPDGDQPDGDQPDGDQPDGDDDPIIPDPGQLGGACTFGPVNPNAGDCVGGGECIGAYADGSQGEAVTCSTHSDCATAFGNQAVCAGGYCGISWCTKACSPSNASACTDLDQGSKKACCGDVGGTSMCYIPDFCTEGPGPGDAEGGAPCPFGPVNANADNCASGYSCIGAHANASSQQPVACSSDADCTSSFGSIGVCAQGYCGVSWCAASCTSDANCNPSHGAGACCEAIQGGQQVCFVPEFCEAAPGDRGAGQTCTFGALYAGVGNCQSGLNCIGMHANASVQQPMPCSSNADCTGAQALNDASAVCVSGYCGIAWCAHNCTDNTPCANAGYGSPSGCCGPVGTSNMCYRASFCQEGR